MDIMAWIMYILMVGNQLLANGYHYDLTTRLYVNDKTGEQVIVTPFKPSR